MIEIPSGRATLGLSRSDENVFGWDNEFEALTVDVPAFAIDKYKVTNGEYLDFVAAGGLRESSLLDRRRLELANRAGYSPSCVLGADRRSLALPNNVR